VTTLKEMYYAKINSVLLKATIDIPESKWFQKGGKNGVHTEHLGYLLADMQYMQRTYPGMEW
jgi:ring-1,2-phenylacetyl-CoA epoxidase subunit PaaC